MKKTINGEEFTVFEAGKIDGDFIHEGVNVFVDGDLEVTGHFKCRAFKITGSVIVGKSYVVEKWEKVEGYQEVVEYQEVGWSQEVGGYQEVGGSQEVGWSQEVGGYQEVGRSQKVGGSQEVGEFQEVGEDCTIGDGSVIMLSSTINGELSVGSRMFVGVCNWRDITDKEKTITCKKLVHGEIAYGILVETDK